MTNGLDDISALVDTAVRLEALAWMADLRDIEALLDPLEKAREQLRGKLKQFMELNADRLDRDERDQVLLWDGEASEGYVLQSRVAHQYDLVSAAESAPEAVLNAAKAGWLKADHASVEKHPGAAWLDALKRYYMPSAGSVALVKKGK